MPSTRYFRLTSLGGQTSARDDLRSLTSAHFMRFPCRGERHASPSAGSCGEVSAAIRRWPGPICTAPDLCLGDGATPEANFAGVAPTTASPRQGKSMPDSASSLLLFFFDGRTEGCVSRPSSGWQLRARLALAHRAPTGLQTHVPTVCSWQKKEKRSQPSAIFVCCVQRAPHCESRHCHTTAIAIGAHI